MNEEEKAYIHWLCQAAGTGNRSFLRSLEAFGTPRELYRLTVRGGLSGKLSGRCKEKAARMEQFTKGYDVAESYERMVKRGIRLVTQKEEAYPKRLLKISDKPYVLYYAGSLPAEGKKAVALVGARECTAYGRYMAAQFGTALARAGVQLVSGMARGIDCVGQESAMKEGGYSVGVLGCGADICYPRENRELYEALLERGGVCSEYPPGVAPRAVFFPPRNRIISGLSDAVLVIEARVKSGTLITVDMALEQGREVYALPGRVTDPLSCGCNRLIRQGAGLLASPEEFLEEFLGEYQGREKCVQTELIFLEGIRGELFSLLDFTPLPIQELQRRYEEKYQKPIALSLLFKEVLELCADGHAGQVAGNYFVKIIKT